MRIIVNDSSCLIDLRKAGLLIAALRLPYRFLVPLPLVELELLGFTRAEWEILQAEGIEIVDLEPALIGRANVLNIDNGKLTANDAMCLALAEAEQDAILLSGDMELRQHAMQLSIEVHGVLWVTDELARIDATTLDDVLAGLRQWRQDPLVFLPADELDVRIEMLMRRLGRR